MPLRYKSFRNNSNQILLIYLKSKFFRQLSSGEIEIDYLDGSKLSFDSKSGDITFSNSSDSAVRYNQKEIIPEWLRCKLEHITKVIPYLLEEDDSCRGSRKAIR